MNLYPIIKPKTRRDVLLYYAKDGYIVKRLSKKQTKVKMLARIYYNKEADLKVLDSETIAIIGYGNPKL